MLPRQCAVHGLQVSARQDRRRAMDANITRSIMRIHTVDERAQLWSPMGVAEARWQRCLSSVGIMR
jgi:hypothetical protein